ncbi:redoxin domain-containing protein [Polyangium spumosum]|uniref:Redoxin domain-containing protein n=1 Tax=Polyangium spumosum TaxID=889282 RepID=A0A6N7PU36_9BACT|nr:redoxin domain-containing protein [Polyangium spumosum]
MVALGGEVVGVSTDKHETQCDFAKSLSVEFPMIGDADKRIAKAYGVLWPIIGLDRRITFVIDEQGIVRGVFNYELLPHKHVDDAIALLRELAAKAG